MNDPVKSCPLYLNEGCSHVDGILCDYPKCSMLDGYKPPERKKYDYWLVLAIIVYTVSIVGWIVYIAMHI